jgi:chromosome segregation ATPase
MEMPIDLRDAETQPDRNDRRASLSAEIARLDWEIADKEREIGILQEERDDLEMERDDLMEALNEND